VYCSNLFIIIFYFLFVSSFIENYGTHIITSVTIGGKDEVFVKLHSSSQLSLSEFENYVREIGVQRFSNLENQPMTNPINYKERVSPLYVCTCVF
jgi:MAC/Perforin domain